MRHSAAAATLLVSVLGCVAPAPAPLTAEQGTSALAADEQYLWKRSREVQFEIEQSGLVFEDRDLDAYLARVLARVTPDSLVSAGVRPRVQVISDVRIHGYSFANGVIYIHTALLARMENETQLATMLTRELAHVVHRHALRLERDATARKDTLAWLNVAGSVSNYAAGAKQLAQALEISSALGFPHALEVEADRDGLAALSAAGYDVREAPRLFEQTVAYLREIHGQGPLAWVPFTTPPRIAARMAGYASLIASEYGDAESRALRSPIADPETFARKTHDATKRQAELELAAGLFVTAEKTARAATESDTLDPEAHVLLGRALVGQRGKPLAGRDVPSIQRVRSSFERALEIAPRDLEATRELGLSYYRKTSRVRPPDSTRQAAVLFRRYLSMAPEAEDADYVRGYLLELEQE